MKQKIMSNKVIELQRNSQIDLFDNNNSTLVVERISRKSAEEWCKTYHYLGGAGSANWCYGIFENNQCVSVIVFTMPANHYGVANKYGLTNFSGNIELTRVATHPNAPKMTTSKAISLALKQFSKEFNLDWVFSYADTGQGHYGGIYQALNAIYLGITKPAAGFTLDGKPIHSRTIARHYGSATKEKLNELRSQGVDIKYVSGLKTPKHLYILLTGNKISKKQISKILSVYSKPYPKPELIKEL